MKILKFGGTSVGTPERIKHVARLSLDSGRNIIVLSAMAGTTNALVEIAGCLRRGDTDAAREALAGLRRKYTDVIAGLYSTDAARHRAADITDSIFAPVVRMLDTEFTDAEEKDILACGELLSTNLMQIYLEELGVHSVLLPALEYMRTAQGGEPDMAYISSRLRSLLDMSSDAEIWLTQGYICRNAYGETDNLRRGGSDYSASIIGAAAGADEIQIWTDIDGMHTGDPRYVEGTRAVDTLHFEEAAELAYFGAKILHPTCILPAKESNIPVRLLNTMDPGARGTTIANFAPDGTIKAVAAKDDITGVTIRSLRTVPAHIFLNRVFEAFAHHCTRVDTASISEVNVALTVDDPARLGAITADLSDIATVETCPGLTIVCIVGDLSGERRGDYCANVLDALRDIPVRHISYGSSGCNISVAVDAVDKQRALRALNTKLFSK